MIRRLIPPLVAVALAFQAAAQSTPHHALPGLAHDLPAAVRGQVTLGELGCARCHTAPVTPSPRFGPKLESIGARVDADWIERYLRDPQAVKPGTVMPHVLARHTGESLQQAARALTHYLVSRGPARFARTAPDRAAAARGRELFHTIGCVACHAPRDAKGDEVATPASVPLGRLEAKYRIASLAAFLDAPRDVRPSGRMPHFGLAPRESADLAHFLLERTPANANGAAFVVDQAQVEKGAKLYVDLRCANCHEPAATPKRDAPKLAGADLTKGCASATLPEDHAGPHYSLSKRQREDLQGVLRAPAKLDAEQQIQRDLATFNCYACHQRDKLGGVTDARNDFFQSHGESLGVSSRIPPPLTGVGAKLKPEWLQKTLAHGQSIRPMMKTRMPGFGPGTAALAAGLSQRDTLPAVEFAALPKDRKQANAFRDQGMKLAGNQGMNCIACHQFAGQSSSTMQSVDLVETTTQRLQKDWFYHYMINPVRFRPGTIMPLFFPGGQTTHKDVLDGDGKQQINALWHYLDRGRNVRKPRGLTRPRMHVEVGAEFAVMLRRSAQNTGKRGISVGLPSGVHFTFDAETLALNQIWWGQFIDTGGVWGGQGSGQVRPLERERAQLPLGPVLATLPKADAPWPSATRRELGHRFRGYTLDKQRRPTFEYEVGGVRVLDSCVGVPMQDRPSILRRTFTFTSRGKTTLYLRLALDGQVTVDGDVVRVGRWLDVRLPAKTKSTVRTVTVGEKKQQKKKEVVVPIAIAGETAFVIDYSKREGK